jgi:hypothetical protein
MNCSNQGLSSWRFKASSGSGFVQGDLLVLCLLLVALRCLVSFVLQSSLILHSVDILHVLLPLSCFTSVMMQTALSISRY